MLMGLSITLHAQINESFGDGNFSANPAWSGTTGWQISANSTVGPTNANGANVLKLNGPNVSGTGVQYLATQVAGSWGGAQTWMFWMGRTTNITGNAQFVWLYANGSNLGAGAGRNGYVVSFGLSGTNRIQLQRVTAGSPTTLIETPTISTSISDYGILVRVTRSPAGLWKLYTSTLPTTTGGGINAATVPSAANTTVDHSATGVTDNTYTNFTDGWVGFRADYDDVTADRSAAEFDNFIFSFTGDALPVKLTSFDAVKDGAAAKLVWTTAEEEGMSNYEIQRSPDGINFSSVGTVAADNKKNYSFADLQPLSGNNFYRLRMNDKDGKYRLSHVVSIKSRISLAVKLSPNPVRSMLTVQHPKATAGSTLQVLSAEGKVVKQVMVPANAVITPVDMNGVNNGTYYITVRIGTEKYLSTVVKQ